MNSPSITPQEKAVPDVSVIIPHYNDSLRLAKTIASLQAQDFPGPIEVLVVDNGSDELPEVSQPALLLQEAAPGSYAARNKALKVARGAIIAFTDSDCLPHPNWISAGVAALSRSPEIGLIGGQVRVVSDEPGEPTIAELFDIAIAFPQEHYIRQGRYAATANVFTRTTIIEAVGQFDANLRSGGDAEWGQRVADAGYTLAYEPEAIVDHPARKSHAEIMKKIRRTTGGERDRRPSLKSALIFAAKMLIPPRKGMKSAMKLPGVGLWRRLQVAAYCVYVNWYHSWYRMKLQLSGSRSQRS